MTTVVSGALQQSVHCESTPRPSRHCVSTLLASCEARERDMEKHLTESGQRRCRKVQVAPVWVYFFTLLASIVTMSAADRENSAAPAVLAKEEQPLTQYRAFRRMHAKSEKFNQEGWLDAWTELDEQGFRYEIVSERGGDTVRNKVLRAVLKREQELIADGQAGRAALTEDNYEFTDGGIEEGL